MSTKPRDGRLIIVVYVDDLIIADNNKELKAAFV
jgi:hypothetical protein